MPNRFFQVEQDGRRGRVYVYGTVGGGGWGDDGPLAAQKVPEIDGLDVDELDVYINSPGGLVDEGWAIYNALKRHPARVTTHNDGFACSIAALIFMAGERRVCGKPSAFMIHNASGGAHGTAEDHRRLAEVLDLVSAEYAQALGSTLWITQEELSAMLAEDTWLTPEQCLSMGFATDVEDIGGAGGCSQSMFDALMRGARGGGAVGAGGAAGSGGHALHGQGAQGDPAQGDPPVPPDPPKPPDAPEPEPDPDGGPMDEERVRGICLALLEELGIVKGGGGEDTGGGSGQCNLARLAANFKARKE